MTIGDFLKPLHDAPRVKKRLILKGVLIQFRDFFQRFCEVNDRLDFWDTYAAILEGAAEGVEEQSFLEMVVDPCEENLVETIFSMFLVNLLHTVWEDEDESIDAACIEFCDILLYENAYLVWSQKEIAERLDLERAKLSSELSSILAPHLRLCEEGESYVENYFEDCIRTRGSVFFANR